MENFFCKFNSSQEFGIWVCQATVYPETLLSKFGKNVFPQLVGINFGDLFVYI